MVTRRAAFLTAVVLFSTESESARADDCGLEPFGDWENFETGADEWFDDTARELGRDIATAPLRTYVGVAAVGTLAVLAGAVTAPVAVTLGFAAWTVLTGLKMGRAQLRAMDAMDKGFQAFLDSD